MTDFLKFQEQAIEGIRERYNPNWQPADPAHELPFHLSKTDWDWLQRNVALNLTRMDKMTTAQVKESFPKSRARLIRTFIWQCWLLIQMGEMKPLKSTLRSLWYRDLEGFMRRHHLVDSDTTRSADSDADKIIESMREEIALFVEHRIFRYSGAFQFVPMFNAAYLVGKRHPTWFFFTEKVGLWESTCAELWKHPKLSNSVMASQGEPSGLALEKMGMEIRRLGYKNLTIFTMSDRDPWGWWIDASIDSYLRRLGFGVQTWRLVTEDLFTEEHAAGSEDFTPVIEMFQQQIAHPDPNFSPTSTEQLIYNWFKLSNGWHGRPLAMHCDKIDEEVRDARIQKFLKELQKKEPHFPGTLVAAKEAQRLLEGPTLWAPKLLRSKFR